MEIPLWGGEFSGMQSVTLQGVTIPPAIIEMVRASVARENVVIPLSQENGVLRLVVHDSYDSPPWHGSQFSSGPAIRCGWRISELQF
jgi:hypothetical protein